jgi:hypothetical protein
MQVWKFKIPVARDAHVLMPRGAVLLHVAEQVNELCVWAQVDPEAPLADRYLGVFGTGEPLPSSNDAGRYLGTVLMLGGTFVAHVWDYGEARA